MALEALRAQQLEAGVLGLFLGLLGARRGDQEQRRCARQRIAKAPCGPWTLPTSRIFCCPVRSSEPVGSNVSRAVRPVRQWPVDRSRRVHRPARIIIPLQCLGGIAMKTSPPHSSCVWPPVPSRFPPSRASPGAQAYPSRPIRIVIGYTPAGSADITARLMGQWLSERLGQTVVIENRPGAGTNLATEAVVRAPADGYTLLLVAPANAINATLFDEAQPQLPARHRAGGGHQPLRQCHGGEPVGAGRRPSRVHRLRQGQSRASSAWRRRAPDRRSTCRGELFKMMTGIQHDPRALSRQRRRR